MAMDVRGGQRASFRRIDMVAVKVVLVLRELRVEGTIHMEPGISRFSDAWDALMRERRTFIPVTDVTIRTQDCAHKLDAVTFMVVEKNEIRAVYPIEG